MDTSITIELESIKEDIYANYCKYPSEYLSKYDDPDEANDYLLIDRCEGCPLQRI